MIKILTLSIFTLLTLTSSLAYSQLAKAEVSGKIVDEQQNPIPFATLSLKLKADSSLVKGSISNEAGKFLFEQINVDAYFFFKD